MTTEEANKIIARFMESLDIGYNCHTCGSVWYTDREDGAAYPGNYSESLDSLTPVWKKLKLDRVTLENLSGERGEYLADIHLFHGHDSIGKTIQEAAAIATAKEIRSIQGEI